MDDLEHSVVIAERDWESFYEESEECTIQQARLASLDDSGFSDTDDKINSTHEPVLDLQTKPDKPDEEPDPTALTQSEVYDCKDVKPSEETSGLGYNTDSDGSAEQTAQISLGDVSSACACLTLDNVSVKEVGLTNQQITTSDIKDFKKHNGNHSQDKPDQAIREPITSLPCIQDAEHAGSSEGDTTLKVPESSTTLIKEKERWFVTVNDSPVIVKVKSGQKKKRKKKTSRVPVQPSIANERQCSVSNNEKEEVAEAMQDRQKLQNEFMQPLQTYSKSIPLNPCPNHCSEEDCNNQEVVLVPIKEPEKLASLSKRSCTSEASSFTVEKTSCAVSFKFKDNLDVHTETLENNPPVSVNSPSPSILSYTNALLQMDALVNDQSIANKPKSNTQFATPDHPMSNSLNHKAHEDSQDDVSRLILEKCWTTTSLEMLQEQKYLTQMQEESKLSSQKTQHTGSQKNSLEAAVGPNCPIYALSSFWDEMEKLTINDILHLQSTHNTGRVTAERSDAHLEDEGLSTSKHDSLQESGLMDDCADSGYFTHVDESKTDRSSCELSTFSDSDEEFLQILNTKGKPSPELQHIKEGTESFESTYSLGYEFDLHIENECLDLKLSRQNGFERYLYPGTEVQSFFLASCQDSIWNPFELEVIRKTPILSICNTADNRSITASSKILTKEVMGVGSSDRLISTVVSIPFAQNLSVCKMYDDFLSDFEVGNFFFPSTQDKIVPIFSASHSVVRELVFPEVEELSFDPDFEEDNMPIRDMTRFSSQSEMFTSPSGMPNLCLSMCQRGNWSSLFSLRRIRFIGKGSIWHHKVSSWIFPNEAKKATSYASSAQQTAPLMQAEHKSLQQLSEMQKHAVLMSSK